MTANELRILTVDGPQELDCPYCNEPGGVVLHAGQHFHQQCYEALGSVFGEPYIVVDLVPVQKRSELGYEQMEGRRDRGGVISNLETVRV